MKPEYAGRGRRRAGPASVRQALAVRQGRLQAMANLIPGALILGLLLTPDDIRYVSVPGDGCSVLRDRERIEFLQTDDGRVFDSVLLAQGRQIVVHPAAAENQPPDLLRRHGFIADQPIEAAFGDFRQR